MSKRFNPWLLALVAVLLSRLIGMALFPFVDTTEPRYAEIARLMVETEDWITPWFEPGVPFWGKPPLSFWAQAASVKLFGLSEFALRLPSWLATIAMVALTWHFALQLWGRRVAQWSVLVFSTMALSYISAGAVMTDAFLALGTTLSLVSFGLVIHGQRSVWRWLFFLGLVIGLLAKGPLAVVLVGIPVGLRALLTRRWPGDIPWFRGLVATAGLTLPWYLLAELKTPGFLDYFIVGEHIRRFIDPGWAGDLYGSAHLRPKGMIWVFWLWASFPWGLLALYALFISVFRGSKLSSARVRIDSATMFALLCVLGPLLFFTLASNTLWTYALPSLPFTAILIARWTATLDEQWTGRLRAPVTAVVPLSLSVFVLVSAAGLYPLKTEQRLTRYYEQRHGPGDSPLLYLDGLPFSARFYSDGKAQAITLEQLHKMREDQDYQRYFIAVPVQWQQGRVAQLLGNTHIEMHNRRYQLLSFSAHTSSQDVSFNAQ